MNIENNKVSQNNSSGNKRIAKNSLFMSIRMIIVLVVSLYTTRVVLNVLGVEDFGVYNVVAGFVSMFAFLNNAMSSATQRFFNFELGKNGIEGARRVYCASLMIHFLLALVIVLVTEPIGLWYLHNKMVLPEGRMIAAEWIFHFSVISLFVTIVNAPFSAAVVAHEKMDFYSIMSVLDVFLKLIMVILLPYIKGDRLIFYGFFFLILTTFNTSLYIIFCKKHFEEIRLGVKVPRLLFKEMLSFSGWSVFSSIAYMLREQGVNLVLNSFFGTIINAARGVANQVNGAIQGFISSIVAPSRPQVIQSYSKGNISRTWNLTFSISKITCLFFFLMSLPICMEVDFILKLWLGDAIPEHTQNFVIIMLATNTIGTFVAPISTVMHATGKIKFYQILSSTSNLMSVPLAYLFLLIDDVPEYAYWALFVTCITNLLAGLIPARKYANLSFRTYFKVVLLPCLSVVISTIPIAFIPHLFLEQGFLRLIIEVVLCVCIVTFFSYRFALNNDERNLVRQLMDNLIKKIKK